MANGGGQWNRGVRSLGSGAILLGFVSLLWVPGPLRKLVLQAGLPRKLTLRGA